MTLLQQRHLAETSVTLVCMDTLLSVMHQDLDVHTGRSSEPVFLSVLWLSPEAGV